MNAEHTPPTPEDQVIANAERIVHDAWRHGEGAALEAQHIANYAHTTDPVVAHLHATKDIVDNAPDAVPSGEADDPLDQAAQTVNTAAALTDLVRSGSKGDIAPVPLSVALDLAAQAQQNGRIDQPPEPSDPDAIARQQTTQLRETLLAMNQPSDLGPRRGGHVGQ